MQPFITVDTETTGLNPWKGDRVFAVSICEEDGNTTYLQWPVDLCTRQVTPKPADVRWLNSILDRPDAHTGWFNYTFDSRMLRFSGVNVRGRIEEVSFAAKICRNQEFAYQLKPLAKKYCGIDDADEKALGDLTKRLRTKAKKDGFVCNAGDGAWKADYWLNAIYLPEDNRCEIYARLDAYRTMALWRMYRGLLDSDPCYRDIYEREIANIPAFEAMADYGLRVNLYVANTKLEQHRQSGLRHQAEVDRIIGWPLDVQSGPQVQKALFDPPPIGQGLPIHKRTPQGFPSTDWKALREHRHNPVVKEIEEVKSANKACSTFFGKMIDLAIPVDDYHVLYPGLNQIGAALTGRVSCSLFHQMQKENSPRGLETVAAREPFGPRPGYIWYKIDYSSQEVRIFAELSRCQKMLDAFARGEKIHNTNANLAWGGKGRPEAIEAAIYALELGNQKPSSDLVQQAWDTIGAGGNVRASREFHESCADRWMALYNYDIIKAEDSVGKNQSKTKAKNVFFAKLYGGGPTAVSDMLFCSDADAAKFLRQFDVQFPEIGQYVNYISELGRRQGWIVTAYGRKLHVNSWEAYKAANYSVQGTAADIMKDSIFKCHKYLLDTGLDAHLVMTVHDELIFEFKIGDDHRWVLRGIKTLMEQTRMKIAMPVEVSRVRECWSKAEEITV